MNLKENKGVHRMVKSEERNGRKDVIIISNSLKYNKIKVHGLWLRSLSILLEDQFNGGLGVYSSLLQ